MWTLAIITLVSFIVAVYFFPTKERNKGKMINYIIYLVACVSFGFFGGRMIALSIPDGFITERTVKEYIIENPETFHLSNVTVGDDITFNYKSNVCYISDYWEEVSIKNYMSDSAYIIVWGDRDSRWWRWRLDKGFWIYNNGSDELSTEIFFMMEEN